MLINLSNHPTDKWTEEQKQAAIDYYGFFEDLPFPKIDPQASLKEINELAEKYLAECKLMFEMANVPVSQQAYNEAVHIMGEMTFTYRLVKLLEEEGVQAVASTTSRRVITESDGTKTSVFKFIRFRSYFD